MEDPTDPLMQFGFSYAPPLQWPTQWSPPHYTPWSNGMVNMEAHPMGSFSFAPAPESCTYLDPRLLMLNNYQVTPYRDPIPAVSLFSSRPQEPVVEPVTITFSSSDDIELATALRRAANNGLSWQKAIEKLDTHHSTRSWSAYYMDNKTRIDSIVTELFEPVISSPSPTRRRSVGSPSSIYSPFPQPPVKLPRGRPKKTRATPVRKIQRLTSPAPGLVPDPVSTRPLPSRRTITTAVRVAPPSPTPALLEDNEGDDSDLTEEEASIPEEEAIDLDSTDDEGHAEENEGTHKSYTKGDTRLVARFIADDLDWELGAKGEKWKEFAARNPAHSHKAWAEFFRVQKIKITAMTSRLRRRGLLRQEERKRNGGIESWRSNSKRRAEAMGLKPAV